MYMYVEKVRRKVHQKVSTGIYETVAALWWFGAAFQLVMLEIKNLGKHHQIPSLRIWKVS